MSQKTFIGPHPPHDGRDWDCMCARCGSSVERVECHDCGGDGLLDVYEEDPINNDPDETEGCQTCGGAGGWLNCLSSAQWCEANPNRSPTQERGAIEWFVPNPPIAKVRIVH